MAFESLPRPEFQNLAGPTSSPPLATSLACPKLTLHAFTSANSPTLPKLSDMAYFYCKTQIIARHFELALAGSCWSSHVSTVGLFSFWRLRQLPWSAMFYHYRHHRIWGYGQVDYSPLDPAFWADIIFAGQIRTHLQGSLCLATPLDNMASQH